MASVSLLKVVNGVETVVETTDTAQIGGLCLGAAPPTTGLAVRSGSVQLPTSSTSSNSYVVATTDTIVQLEFEGLTNVTLPDATAFPGRVVTIKSIGGSCSLHS